MNWSEMPWYGWLILAVLAAPVVGLLLMPAVDFPGHRRDRGWSEVAWDVAGNVFRLVLIALVIAAAFWLLGSVP